MRVMSLTEIAKKHDLCLIDTSACFPNCQDSSIRESYFDELGGVVRANKIQTTPEVWEEIKPMRGTRVPLIPLVNLQDRTEIYQEWRDYFERKAIESNDFDMSKRAPYADIGLAAAACTLATYLSSVGFLSADGRLNRMVFEVVKNRRSHDATKMPMFFKNELVPYAFFKRTALFTPQEEISSRLHRRKKKKF